MTDRTSLASSPFVRVEGRVFHADYRGPLDAPVIVFANSLGTDARIWRAVLSRLPEHYGLLVYDKRGHGLSDAPKGPMSIGEHAGDVLGLLDALGIARFAFVGLSVGGMIGQAIAIAQPERVAALVLCDTAAKIGDADTWTARMEAVERDGMAAIADAVMVRWFTERYRTREADALQGWRNMLVRQPAHGYVATCAAIRDADLRPLVEAIRAPTLCVVGDQDLATPPEVVRATADLIPRARFTTIADAGHIPCVEQPEILAGLILEHLRTAGYG